MHKKKGIQVNTNRETHALDNITIPGTYTGWEGEVKRWREPMGFEERRDWLRRNINNEGDGLKRCIFFLEVADHYGVRDHFLDLQSNEYYRGVLDTFGVYIAKPDQKWILANTAFKVLCNKVFATDKVPYSYLSQFTPPLLTKLLWFFRPYFYNGPNGWDNLRPYSTEGLGKDFGKHYLATAESFARKFATDLWQIANGFWYQQDVSSEGPKQRDVLPHLERIVFLMERLNLLESFRSGQCVPSPDVFRQMVGIAFQMSNQGECLDYKGGIRESKDVLEPLAEKDSKLADVLLSARLHVERWDSKRRIDTPQYLLKE